MLVLHLLLLIFLALLAVQLFPLAFLLLLVLELLLDFFGFLDSSILEQSSDLRSPISKFLLVLLFALVLDFRKLFLLELDSNRKLLLVPQVHLVLLSMLLLDILDFLLVEVVLPILHHLRQLHIPSFSLDVISALECPNEFIICAFLAILLELLADILEHIGIDFQEMVLLDVLDFLRLTLDLESHEPIAFQLDDFL